MKQGYNLKTLAQETSLSYQSFLKEVKVAMSDPEVKIAFGIYRRRCLTQTQLQILIDKIPHLDHLRKKE